MKFAIPRATPLWMLLLAVAAPSAVAQGFACVASTAVPPTVRAGGLAELAGDIVIQCGGSAPPSGIVATIAVTANVPLASRLLDGSIGDTLLLIDEPAPGAQVLGVNVFEGVVAGNTVSFPNVPLAPAPGGPVPIKLLHIANLRVDVDPLGVPPTPVPQVTAVAAIDGTPVPLWGPASSIVAWLQAGLGFSVTPQGFAECSAPLPTVDLRFAEGFPTTLKPRGTSGQSTPGMIYNTETGLVPNPLLVGVGLADSGTQLTARFAGIPAGVQLSVPPTITNGTLTVVAVSPAGGGQVPIVGGMASLAYEVTAANPLGVEAIVVPVTVAYAVGTSVATAVPVTVRGNLGPISTVAGASATAPIPRFADRSIPVTAFSIAACAPVPATGWPTLAGLGLLLFGVGAVHLGRRART